MRNLLLIFALMLREGQSKGRMEGRMEGKAEGRMEGLREGQSKGRMEGLMEGRIEGELRAFLQLVEWILGEPSPRLKSQIEKLTDLAQINTLYEMVAKKQIQSLKELEQKLP